MKIKCGYKIKYHRASFRTDQKLNRVPTSPHRCAPCRCCDPHCHKPMGEKL